jgi:hypothetical protein
MSKTNTLTSHHPERHSNRVDKMNSRSEFKALFKSKHNSATSKLLKKLASKKRRALLRQSKEDKI